MKPRMQPHVSVQNSYAEDDHIAINPVHQDQSFGLIRYRGKTWYQNRRCPNGLLFQLRFNGSVEYWQWVEWCIVEPRLDEFVSNVLHAPIPIPWENPDALDCDLLYLSDVAVYSQGSFELTFSGRYSSEYHEYLGAIFENYELKSVQWGS
jgi:hypothetical protein